MTCSVDRCERPVYVKSRGWCTQHYERWRLHGAPDAPVQRIVFDDELRFWSKVNKTETCWLWTGPSVEGYYGAKYGHFYLRDGKVMAHRYAYEQLVRPIPKGLQIDHLCRQTLCVRPDHLEPVTQAENIRRENLARGRLSPTCRVPGCGGANRCFAFCNTHYLRWKKSGRPEVDAWIARGALKDA